MKSHKVLVLVSLAWAVCPLEPAYAGYIAGVTATTTMGTGFGTNLANTVNAVGLSSPALTATHAGTIPTNSWVSASGTLTGQVTFNLGGSFSVDGFAFWNQNGGGPGLGGITGIQNVTIDFSPDNGVTFNPLPGAPTTFMKVAFAGNVSAEIFNFAAVTATHVRFTITSNWGDGSQTGFAEVAFNNVATGAAPPPSAPSSGPAAAGVTVTQSFGNTNVTEGGATDTITVVLTTAPTANVTITMNPGTQVTVAPNPLTFTPANFATAQTVTVTAVDDTVVEGPHTGTITFTTTSADASYNGLVVPSVTVNITDNDTGPAPGTSPLRPEGAFAASSGPHGNEGSFGGFGRSVAGVSVGAPVLLGPVAECASIVVYHVPPRTSLSEAWLQAAGESGSADGGGATMLAWALAASAALASAALAFVACSAHAARS